MYFYIKKFYYLWPLRCTFETTDLATDSLFLYENGTEQDGTVSKLYLIN